uniref:Voltage-dependent calcium channel alpha-2/delta subunit conserved region domain-containing protein n=1 Tax=Knipowitschia caucasica TaxID=637954 RepID=A0AAV2KSY3_KNICA
MPHGSPLLSQPEEELRFIARRGNRNANSSVRLQKPPISYSKRHKTQETRRTFGADRIHCCHLSFSSVHLRVCPIRPAPTIGVQMTLDLLGKRFWAIAKQPPDTDCSEIEGVCPLSCESADLNCYLLDNNGFIVLSKEREEAGRFFGEVDGSVMANLLKMGLYKKVLLFDYQAMCKNSHHHHHSSARPLLSPFYGIVGLLRWFFSNALMFLLDFNFCGLWHSDYFVEGKAGYHTTHKQKKVEAYIPCETNYPGVMYDPSVKEANSLIKCGRCQKMFVVQQIPDSNLVLVVTQADCDCSRQYEPIPLQPKEIKYILSPQTQRSGSTAATVLKGAALHQYRDVGQWLHHKTI